jgi:hypothetical protein
MRVMMSYVRSDAKALGVKVIQHLTGAALSESLCWLGRSKLPSRLARSPWHAHHAAVMLRMGCVGTTAGTEVFNAQGAH